MKSYLLDGIGCCFHSGLRRKPAGFCRGSRLVGLPTAQPWEEFNRSEDTVCSITSHVQARAQYVRLALDTEDSERLVFRRTETEVHIDDWKPTNAVHLAAEAT